MHNPRTTQGWTQEFDARADTCLVPQVDAAKYNADQQEHEMSDSGRCHGERGSRGGNAGHAGDVSARTDVVNFRSYEVTE